MAPRRGPRGRRAGLTWLLAALVLVALTVVVTGGATGLRVRFALIVLAIVGTAIGVRRNRPGRRRPWRFLLAGMVLSAAGDVAVLAALRDGPVTASVPLDAWLTAASGLLFLAGLLDATRPLGRGDVGGALDALIATLASGCLVWQLIVVPAAAPGWAGSGTELAGALQVAVLLAVLVLLARVAAAVPPGRRVAALALTVAVLTALVAFVIGALHEVTGGDAYSGLRAGFGAVANLSAAVAALHPSMRALTADREPGRDAVSLPRTLVLGLALAAPPAVLLVATLVGRDVGLASLAVTWVVLAAAVLARVHLLQRGRERAQDELARSEHRLVSLVANTRDTVLLVALPTGGAPVVRFASPACRRLLGRTPTEVRRSPIETLSGADDGRLLHSLVTGDAPLPRAADVRIRHTDGSHRWVEAVVDAAPQEEERSVVVTLRDVDDRKRAELLLAEAALRDELTGLWNRRGLYALLDAALAAPVAPGGTPAVIIGDLDGFKAVNDRAGHAAGDAILRAIAGRLRGAVRDGDEVGRLGGDEFLVLCRSDGEDTLLAIADRVLAVGQEPFVVDGVEHRVGISVGVALARRGQSVDDLVLAADRALYSAKDAGKGKIRSAAI